MFNETNIKEEEKLNKSTKLIFSISKIGASKDGRRKNKLARFATIFDERGGQGWGGSPLGNISLPIILSRIKIYV